MARPRRTVEIPGQPADAIPNDAALVTAQADAAPGVADAIEAPQEPATDTINAVQLAAEQEPAMETVAPSDIALAARYAALSMLLSKQGLGIVERFDDLEFTDPAGQRLTSHPAFIALVNRATTATPAPEVVAAARSEEGVRRLRGAPVLTDAGWHVPG